MKKRNNRFLAGTLAGLMMLTMLPVTALAAQEVPLSLMDHRIVSPREARSAVNEYMTSVLHEEPVDPSLVDFDDSMGW